MVESAERGGQSTRGDLARALDQARMALAAADDVGLASALRQVEALAEQLRLTQKHSAGADG